MYASVELKSAEENFILPARNISLGGVYLTADGHDISGFSIGATVEVQVFDALDARHKSVQLEARVVRIESAGMALMWSSTDPDAAAQLAKLLQSLRPKPKK